MSHKFNLKHSEIKSLQNFSIEQRSVDPASQTSLRYINGVQIKCVEVSNAPLKANCSRQGMWTMVYNIVITMSELRLRDTFVLTPVFIGGINGIKLRLLTDRQNPTDSESLQLNSVHKFRTTCQL